MSNAVSALNGASFTGIAKIEEAGLQGMITVRGLLMNLSLFWLMYLMSAWRVNTQNGA